MDVMVGGEEGKEFKYRMSLKIYFRGFVCYPLELISGQATNILSSLPPHPPPTPPVPFHKWNGRPFNHSPWAIYN